MKKDCMTMSGTAVCQNSIFRTLALSRLRISSLRMAVTIASFFSSILEEKVSPVQALCLINLMLALLMTVFPVSMPLLLRALFIVWLGIALRVCRQSGIK